MAKDPAMLWYWNDWNSGTVTLSRHLKGCYIDLLHAQFNCGHLSLEEVKTILGTDFEHWPTLKKKFETDKEGLFFNKRLEFEQEKRKAFTASRRENLNHKAKHIVTHMDSHMENENRDINTIDNRIGGAGGKDRAWFEGCLDELYRENLAMTHKGKDLEQAIGQAWAYLVADPNRLRVTDSSGVKQLVNTWLSNMKEQKPETKRAKLL